MSGSGPSRFARGCLHSLRESSVLVGGAVVDDAVGVHLSKVSTARVLTTATIATVAAISVPALFWGLGLLRVLGAALTKASALTTASEPSTPATGDINATCSDRAADPVSPAGS